MTAIRLLLLSLLFGGCVARGSLRKDLFPAGPAAAKAAARVVVVRRPGPPETLRHRELPAASVELDLSAYPDAAAAMLSTLYHEVAVEPTVETSRGADFVVSLSTDYPRIVGMTFRDASGTQLAEFLEPGVEVRDNPDAHSRIVKILAPPAMIVSFGTLGLAFAWQARDAGKRIGADLSDATAKALGELRRRIAATPSLQRALVAPAVEAPPQGELERISAEAERLEKAAAALRARIAELEKRR